MITDTLTNLVANLATGTAKSVHDKFGFRALNDFELESMYRGDWMARKVIDLPVSDMLRPWRSWQADNQQIEVIEDAERRHQIRAKLKQAFEWARLYGGSVMIIGAEVGAPDKPLEMSRIGKGGLKYLRVLPRRMITPMDRNLDPISPLYGEPAYYTISSAVTGSVEIHPSRVIRFIGKARPDFDTNVECWGDSLLQVVYDALHAAALSHTGIAELIHEAKIDVIKVKNLGAMLSTDDGTKLLLKRFQNASMLKSINNTLLLETDEEHSRTQTSFTGLPDTLMAFMQVVAGAADMPVTRLLGTAPKGLNATGEGDLKNYWDMLDGLRQDELRPKLELLDQILWRDAMGAVPKDAFFTFNPLAQMTASEKADLAKKKAETAQIYAGMGVMPEEALAEGIVNGLIEDETFPGLEAAIEEAVGPDGDLIPEHKTEKQEIEVEHAKAELRSAKNGPKGQPKAADRAAPGPADGGIRDQLTDDAEWLCQVYSELDARERLGGGAV